jgi:hypothetical protein
VEFWLLITLVLLAMLAVPVAAALGSEENASLQRRSVQEMSSRYPARATLLADAPLGYSGPRSEVVRGDGRVAATWRTRDGADRSGRVLAGAGARAGSEVEIWLDGAGDPVPAPLTPVQAAGSAVTLAAFGWFLHLGLLAVIFWLARLLLDGLRYARWARDWQRVSRNWTHS